MEDKCNTCGIRGNTGEKCPQCLRPARCSHCQGMGILLVPVRVGAAKVTPREYRIMSRVRAIR